MDSCPKVLCKEICIINNKRSHSSQAKVAENDLFASPSYIKSLCLYLIFITQYSFLQRAKREREICYLAEL